MSQKSLKNSPDENLFKARITALQAEMQKRHLAAVLVENPIDIFYLTGVNLSLGKIALRGKEAFLIVDGRYAAAARDISPLPVVEVMAQHFKVPFWENWSGECAYESSFVTVEDAEWRKAQAPHIDWKPVSGILKPLRAIKSEKEQQLMKQAAELTQQGILHILKKLAKGVSEKAMGWEFEAFCRQQGAEKVGFEPIIAFGENTALPHHRAGNRTLGASDAVLIDVGIVLNKYHSDVTRSFFFGKMDSTWHAWYRSVREAQNAALLLVKPGIPIGSLDAAAKQVFRNAELEHLFIHSLGHGVGLEIHEFPRISAAGVDAARPLERGMAITIEPGLYEAGRFGIRYEDTIFVDETGPNNLYKSFELDEQLG